MFYRIKRDGEKIVLQYLMVLQHRNITHTSMITVKCKTNDGDVLKNSRIQAYQYIYIQVCQV